MPQTVVEDAIYRPTTGVYRIVRLNDEAVTSPVYANFQRAALKEIYRSTFWLSKARFAEARERLNTMVYLEHGWDTYGAESPNDVALSLAAKILEALEEESLPPTRLMPSAEGGVAISFVEGNNRAEIEIYNTGEVAAATYSGHSEPAVWELDNINSELKRTIAQIRVHLAA